MNKAIYQLGPHFLTIGYPYFSERNIHIDALFPTFAPFRREPSKEEGSPLFDCLLVEQTEPLLIGQELIRFECDGTQTVINATESHQEILITPPGEVHPWRMLLLMNEHTVIIEVGPDHRQIANTNPTQFVLSNFLMMAYLFFATPQKTLLMNAAAICYQGEGYIFLGKDNAEINTYIALWKAHISNSEVISNDNTIIYVRPDDRVMIYRSPWSAKTPCPHNRKIPLGSIIRLQQAPDNRMKQEDIGRAFASLLPSCSYLKQDERNYQSVIDTISSIITHTPVYLLNYLPQKASVELCCEYIIQ